MGRRRSKITKFKTINKRPIKKSLTRNIYYVTFHI